MAAPSDLSDHRHGVPHRPPPGEAARRADFAASALSVPAGLRLAVATVLALCLWLAVGWALGWTLAGPGGA